MIFFFLSLAFDVPTFLGDLLRMQADACDFDILLVSTGRQYAEGLASLSRPGPSACRCKHNHFTLGEEGGEGVDL